MNNSKNNIFNSFFTDELALITHLGGGEVRVDQALAAHIVAWDHDVPTGALSLGMVDVANQTATLTKTYFLTIGGNPKCNEPLPSVDDITAIAENVTMENAIFIAQTEIACLDNLSLDRDIPNNVSDTY
jgi:hypothetical protein